MDAQRNGRGTEDESPCIRLRRPAFPRRARRERDGDVVIRRTAQLQCPPDGPNVDTMYAAMVLT